MTTQKKKKKKPKPPTTRATSATPAPPTPRWRALRPGDVDAVIALGQALFAEDPGTRPIGKKDIARTLRAFAREPVRGRCVVADAGPRGARGSRGQGQGAVIGYALLCSFWSNELGGEVCTLDEFYVQHSARGAGLGSTLVRGLVDGSLPWFKKAVALELEVTPSNQRARALYERLGFVPRKNASLRLLR